MTKLTSPLKWHGGKHYLAPWIISHFPTHTHYVEPYFGGGSVLLQKPEKFVHKHSEVVNDIDSVLMNFWRTIANEILFKEFQSRIVLTPFAEELFNKSKLKHDAISFFILARQSRQGLLKDFATLSRNRTRRGMNEQVSSWLSSVEGLEDIHNRLKRVVIFNRPALDAIKSQDGSNTFFYLDPPYLPETRVAGEYRFEMSKEDHVKLLELLKRIKGKFLLSGYDSELYNNYGFNKASRLITNSASSSSIKDLKEECLWRNY